MSGEGALFPGYQMSAFKAPSWFIRSGLHKYRPLLTMLRQSWEHWGRAEADGLSNLSPIIMIFNASPADIRGEVGGHVWHRIRTASTHANVNRMALRLIGGWSLDEAMEWPEWEKRHAKEFLKHTSKGTLLTAIRHTSHGERITDNLILARDFTRLGGVIDPTWGKKRLKREHDALAIQQALSSADPTPWAKPWHADIDGYTFSLLKSESELAIEGIAQRHCCRSYARACREGQETVFSIMGPERATVSWNSRYKELQVKAFANRGVSMATRQAAQSCVFQYFAEARP